jgi:hypothetical protein
MAARRSDWRKELGRFLKPFLDRLGHKARRRMCPLYVSGLSGPGTARALRRWRSLHVVTTINCTTSSRPASGMPGLLRQNCWFKRISLSAAFGGSGFVYYPYLKKARSAPAHYVHATVARQVDGIFIAQLNCPRTSTVLPLKT